jgi:prefoldin subunit 5
MKNIVWLIVGVGIGFYAAHRVNQTPQGRAFFEDVDSKAREFSEAVVEGYKAREAELRSAVADAEDALANLANRD